MCSLQHRVLEELPRAVLLLMFGLLPRCALGSLHSFETLWSSFMNSFIQQMPGPMLGENRPVDMIPNLKKHPNIHKDWIF